MSASFSPLKSLSKFVLEVNPMICAAAIGAYVLGSVIAQSSAQQPVKIATPEAFELSGEEITAIVQTANAATLAARPQTDVQPQAAVETALKVEAAPAPKAEEPRQHVLNNERKPLPAKIAAPRPAPRATQTAAAALQRHKSRPVETAALAAAPMPLPPPPAAIAPKEERSWYGRTWDKVSGWTGDAAGAVVAAPGAVVRASKRTYEVVTDAVIPGR